MSVKLDVGCIWQVEGHFGYGEEARDFDGNGRTTPGGRGGRRREEKGGEGMRREGEDIQTKRKEEKNNKE